MRTPLWIIASVLLLIGCGVIGTSKVEPVGDGKTDCLGAAYAQYSYGTRVTVPDAQPAGVVIGPVRITSAGTAISDVVLQVDIVHPCPGDIRLWLSYDSDNDGTEEARAPLELHKARTGRCDTRDPFACPCALDGTYYFREERERVGIDGASVSVFEGLPEGGCFYLGVADTLQEDTGAVRGWAVYVKQAEDREVSLAGNVGSR